MTSSKKKKYYYQIPEKLYLYPDSKICDGAKLLYPLLVSLSKNMGYCYATNKYLGRLRNKSIGTISKFISQLNNEGFIKVQLINNGSGRRIFIVKEEEIRQLSGEAKDKANAQIFENLSSSLVIKMKQNVTKRNSTTLSKNGYPPCRIMKAPLSKCDYHINNTHNKKFISKEKFLGFVNSFESNGNRVYCDVNYFYVLMSNHNGQINSEDDPYDGKAYFIKGNNMYAEKAREENRRM